MIGRNNNGKEVALSTTQPVILVILDGFGINPRKEGNAIAHASMRNFAALLRNYPNASLSMSGMDVGLPDGQMGNSEVGHMILGAGRIVYQDLTLIHKDIDAGGFQGNRVLLEALRKAKAASGRLHLMGLLGDGGVHSHQRHMEALLEMARREKVPEVYLHLFLDGRDTPPTSAEQFILDLNEKLKGYQNVKIATVSGRYYAMDRDKRWDRVEKAYACLTEGAGNRAGSALEAVRNSYRDNVTDEFVLPTVIDGVVPDGLIRDGDGVIFFNFRADRARELTRALTAETFAEFSRRRRVNLSAYTTMTQYDETFNIPAAYLPRETRKIIGEIASQAGIKQLRIAETEKYAHVTYFFNGGEESKFPGEERILIPSPKDVATYDLKPEMSARPVTEALVKHLREQEVGLVIANYANADMVGHTGNFEAAVRACEVIDECLGKVVDAALGKKGKVIITADHGNIEQLIDYDTGMPHTAHTTNRVPVILVDEERKQCRLNKGTAIDVAPTILQLLNLPLPKEMTGHSLIAES
ncbi:MAG: 2,3-bisphosphoglycerate-independent phosphoglycerate mutase [Deltaproteobacteria bacterium]|nr:2,3-bisphosphoglycerate-independent phosphoglycerate mutase [Deltaproteobacteria bacterium]MBI2182022.1 2,3-bisphosphoglycerate-independent phosphoglycerate mutase [Deltaproteobacteria bacterium]MBI2229552.1 2,3-bisphosphoglycerate-independent phosphoglycerate mutase [Deltaproteobacteria bacterium]MBI2533229.1 2,3-bisphosphoglycerate-independent phosphoglycerate mutase [Deltaproteobacteria bacterium]MBI3064769.1 2,3-bisphosphoglycerate-independent phosphoglycerate mutase [Deltaproteobacteria